MKRVITPNDISPKGRCEKYSLSTEKFLQDADKHLRQHDFYRAGYDLERAYDHMRIFRSCIRKLEAADDLSQYSDVYNGLWDKFAGYKRELQASTVWSKLSGSEQYAVEIAKRLISQGWSIDSAVHEACFRVGEGNAEPEYADEEFYQDEPDEQKVIEYLKLRGE